MRLTPNLPAATQSTVASPTAPASTSAYKMQGLAGTITPAVTGNVLVIITGSFHSTTVTAGDGILVQMSYGTSTAPSNAGTLAGTQLGAIVEYANAHFFCNGNGCSCRILESDANTCTSGCTTSGIGSAI
jgi:flagellar biosynthesis protein FliR